MNRRNAYRILTAVAAIAALALVGGCSYPALPGHTYLAIDWVSSPQAIYFPAFPTVVYAGEYVEHSTGSYAGEYIAWDGSYWRADYTINVEPGIDGALLSPADDGDDYYLTMWLYSFGPSMDTDDIVFHAVVPTTEEGQTEDVIEQVPGDSALLERARNLAADTEPTVYTAARSVGRVTVTARFEQYEGDGGE